MKTKYFVSGVYKDGSWGTERFETIVDVEYTVMDDHGLEKLKKDITSKLKITTGDDVKKLHIINLIYMNL